MKSFSALNFPISFDISWDNLYPNTACFAISCPALTTLTLGEMLSITITIQIFVLQTFYFISLLLEPRPDFFWMQNRFD